jgi:acetaldehyde dehydrogenase/alcohol dehydrogenase
MPRTIAAAGVDEAGYRAAMPELAMAAFGDLSLRTNPRMPLVTELRQLLEAAV